MVVHHVFLAAPAPRWESDPIIYIYCVLGRLLLILVRSVLFLLLFFFYVGRELYAANRRTTKMAVQPAPDKTRPYGVGPRAPFGRL
jgi:hypothetical protein